MKGIKAGETRSGLYFDGYKILKLKRPKISIIENVKNLTSKRFKNEFNSILEDLEKLGYNNYWKVLNSKDYGIPQNRERVFIVSIRKDIDRNDFDFPSPIPLQLKLKDILEESVDEKYYLSEKALGRLIEKNNKLLKKCENSQISSCIIAGYNKLSGSSNQYIAEPKKIIRVAGMYDTEKRQHQAGSIYNIDGISPTLTTMNNGGNKQPFVLVREATKEGYTKAMDGDSINYSYPNNIKKRGRVGKGVSQAILTSPTMAAVIENPKPICLNNQFNQLSVQDRIYDVEGISTTITASTFRPNIAERKTNLDHRQKIKEGVVFVSEDGKKCIKIRKLTALECWRLMRL